MVFATAIVFAAAVAAAHPCVSRAGSNFFFGISSDDPKSGATAIMDARSLGTKALRLTLQWAPGQTTLAQKDIDAVRRVVAGAPDMRIVLSVWGGPTQPPLTPADRDNYCAYLRNALAAAPSVHDITIWNEPNLSYFWQPQFKPDGTSASPAAYEALLARCWDVLHASDPTVNVIGLVTGPHGNDDPNAVSNISHAAATFIRKVGEVYRASGRKQPLFDTVGHHVWGDHSAERPWKMHAGTHLSEGDYGKLMGALAEAFAGTGQPTPGECAAGRCVSIWYLEGGFQTAVPAAKASFYFGAEPNWTVPDDAGGEPLLPTPSVDSLAPDQSTQIGYALRLAYCQPYVESFFNFMLFDDPNLGRWQSGPFWTDGTPKASSGAFEQTIADVQTGAVSCALPTPPAPFTAKTRSDCKVALAWGPSSSTIGVSGYRLSRAGLPLTDVSGTTYVDSGAACGGTYSYTVRAFDAAGQTSAPAAASTLGGAVSPVVADQRNAALATTTARLHVAVVGKGRIVSAPSGIDCGLTCSASYRPGAAVVLVARPAKGWSFRGWSDPCGGGKPVSCFLRLSSETTVTARFGPPKCIVPRLAGRSRRAAARALRKAGCRLGKVRWTQSKRKRGLVVAQRPRAGRRLPLAATVQLVLSIGPPRKPAKALSSR